MKRSILFACVAVVSCQSAHKVNLSSINANAYTVGGVVLGLAGTVVIQLNGASDLSLNQNGSFVFPTPVETGTGFNVTVASSPQNPAQTCTVSGGAGVVEGPVLSVTVSCACTGCASDYANATCTAPHHQSTLCQAGNPFWVDACGIAEDQQATCAAGQPCVNGACCVPNCTGLCGGAADGCGGTCQACPSNFVCQATSCAHCGSYDEACCASSQCGIGLSCSFGRCVQSSCSAAFDLTRCAVVTAPDRAYDICVSGACVSPGCGDSTCNPPQPSFPLADTSQKTCYDTTAAISCPVEPGGTALLPCLGASGATLCGQDAQYGWDAHPSGARLVVSASAIAEPVVTDQVTGLLWQGGVGAPSTLDWSTALDYCNALNWNGLSGWRLPDRYELHSIVDHSATASPFFDATAFVGATDSYWTSSTYSGDAAQALYFPDDNNLAKSTLMGVRCVSGGGSLRVGLRYARSSSSEPVVSDAITKLMWQGCPAGLQNSGCTGSGPTPMTWPAAIAYCSTLTWNGLADWRLPSLVELGSVVSDRQAAATPAIDASAFPNNGTGLFWTSTTVANVTTHAYIQQFYYSSAAASSKASPISSTFVRCVRTLP